MSALSEFSSLHPMVVHFPIVLLVLAPGFQATGLLLRRHDWIVASSFLLFAGIAAALIASRVFHAEPIGPTEAVRLVFENHETFANYTLWTAAAAGVCKLPGLHGRFRLRWLEVVALALMLGAFALVSVTGHLGAELTHIHHVKAE